MNILVPMSGGKVVPLESIFSWFKTLDKEGKEMSKRLDCSEFDRMWAENYSVDDIFSDFLRDYPDLTRDEVERHYNGLTTKMRKMFLRITRGDD